MIFDRDYEPVEEPEHAEWCATHERNECDCHLTLGACPVCGERGACAFDPQGFPLIHLNPANPGESL
jgi:hypothetical protein